MVRTSAPLATTTRDRADILIEEYTCVDSHDTLPFGKFRPRTKTLSWRVQVPGLEQELDVRVRVHAAGLVFGPEVNVTVGNSQLFPLDKTRQRYQLGEDFEHSWTVYATLRDLSEPYKESFYEVKPDASLDTWYPATLTSQRGDGTFEAWVTMPNVVGIPRPYFFPAVCICDIREARTKKPLQIDQKTLVLRVPSDDPMTASLTVEGDKPEVAALARWTPFASDAVTVSPSLQLNVSKYRTHISSSVGHSVLSHFLSGEVRNVSQEDRRLRKSWTIEVGPGILHTIEIKRDHWPSNVVTLKVDGKVMVRSSTENIGCSNDAWHCDFQLVGERHLMFDMNEVTRFGNTLDSRNTVQVPLPFSHSCCVFVRRDNLKFDIPSAILTIDGKEFTELPFTKNLPSEAPLVDISWEVFKLRYGLDIPHKVRFDASIQDVNPLQGTWHAAVAVGDAITAPLAKAVLGDTFTQFYAKGKCDVAAIRPNLHRHSTQCEA
eukprot:TRINITY_DN3898_c0_g2_i1.p1 TRINITY_DN3898_c0_g2~~TRINITY_DN3898_c0_g2_i1.p1  ORF type:complete len:507 (-),score=58.47 TRINITY_DN3898_c0_g2_i1:2102-3571(-)